MARLAFAGIDGVEVSDLEVGLPGPSYTSRTLEMLKESSPDQELTLLLGADAASAIESWQRPERVVELARIGLAARPGASVEEAEAAFARLGARDRLDVFALDEVDASSTAVRERVSRGLPIDDLVPAAVADLITSEGIYS